MKTSSCLLLAVAAACLLSHAIICDALPLSAWIEGSASFFGGPPDGKSNAYKATIDSGSCGYGDIDPRLYPFYNVVGLHKSNALVADRPQDACGSCLEVQCNSGEAICASTVPITAVITDQCVNDCDSTNLNIHVFGFEQLAKLRFGRVHIRYRLVECEPADPITIHIMDYRASDGGWLRFSLKNVAGDAALVAVDIGTSTANGSQQEWMPCKNTYGAVWEAGIGGVRLPNPPLDMRITNSLQQQVIIKNFVAFAGVVGDIETTGQFPSPFESQAGSFNASSDAFVAPTPLSSPSVTVGVAVPRPTNTLFVGALPDSANASNTNANLTAPPSSPPSDAVLPAANNPASNQPPIPPPIPAAQPQQAAVKPQPAAQGVPSPVLHAAIKPQQPATYKGPSAAPAFTSTGPPPATPALQTGNTPWPAAPRAVDTSKQVVLAKQRQAVNGRRILREP